jgi:hypothetical protein
LAYTVQAVPEEAVAQQRASFTALLERLGKASFTEIEAVMAEREEVEPKPGLTPEVTARLRERLAERRPAA